MNLEKLFGFGFKRKEKEIDAPSFVPKETDDGAILVAPAGGYGTYVDLDGSIRSDVELISKYRDMALHPEIDIAIDEITNHSICIDEEKVVEIDLDETPLSASIKKAVQTEFNNILTLIDFNHKGYDIFRKWYIDGRLAYHVIVDEKNKKDGIKEFRYIDPRKIKKVKEIEKIPLKGTNNTEEVSITKTVNEYFVYNDKGFVTKEPSGTATSSSGLKISKDSIIYITSGITDPSGKTVISYLHKAIKPLNQLRTLEDAAVIYRLARAPERRIWYIDVGNLPKMKAEQYVRDIMVKHKNKLTYDSATGDIRDDRKYLQMLDDYWLPRREGGRGTEVTTLPGGQNLGEMDDVQYFKEKLYNSLNVPLNRLDKDNMFDIGNSSQITREELRFGKFIFRLRTIFSNLFLDILEKQLILKEIMTIEEWEKLRAQIKFDFSHDSYFTELKDAEILQNRMEVLQQIQAAGAVGVYYSNKWIRKHVLKQSDEDIADIDKEIEEEGSAPDMIEDSGDEQQTSTSTIKSDDKDVNPPLPNKNDLSGAKRTYEQLINKPNKTMDEYAKMQSAAQKLAKSDSSSAKRMLKYGKYSKPQED